MTALSTAHRRGRRASGACEPTATDVVARSLGFVVLACASLATLAAVVLLPPWARLVDAQYERDVLAARIADEQAMVTANERLIKALPDDVVLTRRLAMSDLNALPRGQRVFEAPAGNAVTLPATVTIEPAARPEPPEGWMVSAGLKLSRPGYRRGVFLLAISGLVAAMVLFPPVSSPRKPT
ncbi:MAG: hypothetical protein ACP5HU_08805 [Phycisphaerae bacterium]